MKTSTLKIGDKVYPAYTSRHERLRGLPSKVLSTHAGIEGTQVYVEVFVHVGRHERALYSPEEVVKDSGRSLVLWRELDAANKKLEKIGKFLHQVYLDGDDDA